MRGSIRKRGNTYGYVIDLPRDASSGKRRQKTKGGFRTKRDCQAALNEALVALRSGAYVEPSRRSLRRFLQEEWLPAMAPPARRPSTWETYRVHVEAYLIPIIGDIEIQRLTPAHVHALHRDLLQRSHRRGGGVLSVKTVRNTHMVLHRALADATRWGYVIRNVADLVDPPKPTRTEMAIWSPEQMRSFLAHVRGDRLFAAWLLASTTGMRRGELLGLMWPDVDLEAGKVSVRQARVIAERSVVVVSEPKTARGRRVIALDPASMQALRAWRKHQAAEQEFVGEGYVESGFVFTRPDGNPIHPHFFSDCFERLAKAAGLPKIRLHDLRHSFASAALAAGVPAKVVSERMGHAITAITLDTYTHVLPGLDGLAATSVARLILGDPEDDSETLRDQNVTIPGEAAGENEVSE